MIVRCPEQVPRHTAEALDSTDNPRADRYFVDLDDCGSRILDALIWIREKVEPTLIFRRSCRDGICGPCAVEIDAANST